MPTSGLPGHEFDATRRYGFGPDFAVSVAGQAPFRTPVVGFSTEAGRFLQ
jgi:hypothetical protein